MEALKDQNADVRTQAMWALAESRDRRATAAITGALKDADPKVRAWPPLHSPSSAIPHRSMR